MKRIGAVLGAIFFGFSASAQARAIPVRHEATRVEQARALQIAYAYWRTHAPARDATSRGMPRCGTPRISWQAFPGDTGDAGAEVIVGDSCRIVYNPKAWTWVSTPARAGVASGTDEWQMFCTITVHEIGHLILGPTFFAASNPADPAHSATPGNVMYPVLVGVEVPGCVHSRDPS